MRKMFPPRYAVVDIGSNGIRAALYSVNLRDELFRYEGPSLKFQPELAAGLHATPPRIKEKNLQVAEGALKTIAEVIRDFKILPENVCAVATAAARIIASELDRKDFSPAKDSGDPLSRLQRAFAPFTFKIITGKSEAQLIGETAILDPEFQYGRQQILAMGGTIPLCSVFAIGGGSTEICDIDANGVIHNPRVLEYGLHTLLDIAAMPSKSLNDACDEYMDALYAVGMASGQSVLYLSNGAFRALRSEVCGQNKHFIFGKRKIMENLADVTRRPLEHFRLNNEKDVRDRYRFMVPAATILSRIVEDTEIGKIVFLENRMVSAMAHRRHNSLLGMVMPPIEAIPRPYVPSAPAPARPFSTPELARQTTAAASL